MVSEKKTQEKEERIPLNIVLTYPVHWSRYKVFRDFQQNFYDSVGFREWKQKFHYEYKEEMLTMGVEGVTFHYEWLMHIGASTKTNSSGQTAGFYGEGFKIAALCAMRDFGWQVTMRSGDWELTVDRYEHVIDQQKVQMMCYKMHKKEYQNESVLTLFPVSEADFDTFQDTILTFYYEGNPLLGEKIWEGEAGAVYTCNKSAYLPSLPYTDDFGREGAVFCGLQLLGSNPFGLVVCDHHYENRDRDRRSLYTFDVVGIFKKLAYAISPRGAMRMLESMRRKWLSVPHKRYDIHSWYGTVNALIYSMRKDAAVVEKFRVKYPNLLCLQPVDTIDERNRRSQARSWMEGQEVHYSLVQFHFMDLGYLTLEQKCEECGGFVSRDDPTETENACFAVLEGFVAASFEGFFPFSRCFPARRVIRNQKASWHGMANTFPIQNGATNDRGLRFRNRISDVYLKALVFRKNGFFDALSTYVHELCHCFGGDSSQSFSLGLTFAMERMLASHQLLEQYQQAWCSLFPSEKADSAAGLPPETTASD